MNIQTEIPAATDTRSALYRGEIFHLPAAAETRALVEDVLVLLRDALGDDFRHAQFEKSEEDFFQAIKGLRKAIYTEQPFIQHVRNIMEAHGFDPAENAFDPIRIRVIQHEGHLNPRAAPVFYGHRDTWYANEQNQVTWWIPLHDVEEADTFVFYPEYFARPVHNNSEVFDHDGWIEKDRSLKIGWQKKDSGLTAQYPQLLEEPEPGMRIGFSSRAAKLLLFAGQHLHKTRLNFTGRTRFSIDFRTVNLGDLRGGIVPQNVDNRSTGSSLPDHVQPV